MREVMKRIKENIILQKSPLNLDHYSFEELKPESLYFDKRYNINENIQQAAQMQNKSVRLSSMETVTNISLLNELKEAPFSFNNIRESGLKDTFGIPLLSTFETIIDEGKVIPLQETYSTALANKMSYSNSKHQELLQKLIKDYKGLNNYSEDELKIYEEAMKYYQDDLTFNKYLSENSPEDTENDHYFYFKSSTLDSFIRECIIVPLKLKCDEIGEKFNKTVIRDFKLDKTFKFVRQIYFMEAGKDMSIFCNTLFDKLDQNGR